MAYKTDNPNPKVTNITIVGPEDESKKKLKYIPENEATMPMTTEHNITLVKLFESNLAEIAGPTITAARSVTPIEDIEDIIIVAKTKENNSSTK